MKTRFIQTVATIIALAIAAISFAQETREDERGEVVDVDVGNRTITIETADGIDTFDVDMSTEITFRDRRGSTLADINRGDRVRLDFEEATDGKRKARRIQEDDDTSALRRDGSVDAMNQSQNSSDRQNSAGMSSDNQRSNNNVAQLPKTASSIFGVGLVGLLLMAIAGLVRVTRKSRVSQ